MNKGMHPEDLNAIRKQRDELLAALEQISEVRKDAKKNRCDNVFLSTVEKVAISAIASVKGGAA
jgi:hypothetical protein